MGMHTEKLHRKIREWRGLEASRAEDVGEQRADMKDFLELTGWSKTALAFIRKLDKMDEGKREDILRSFDDLRNEMQPVWDGASTPDMFGHNSKDEVEFADPEEPAPDYHQDAPATDEEAVEFNAAVDAVSDDTGNVVRPFGVGKKA